MNTFRFRLNCIDHYQAAPTDLDPVLRRYTGGSRREHVPQVPVIRIFGATETGQKVCAHVHGALPYLYVEYNGGLDKDEVKAYIANLRASIDHALASTYRRNPYDGKSVYVGHISLIKGVPYYGYHVGYRFFLKIYLLDPLHMTRFTDLLHQGAILNRVFQPYESHLQYLLQWMCDYNLYGCAYINCAKVQFRGPVPASEEIDTTTHQWHDGSIPETFMANPDQYPRQSHCTLEVDLCVQDILNRHELHYRPIHHSFNEKSHELRPDEKYVPSMAGLWKDETFRRKLRMGLTDPSSSPFPTDVLVSMSASNRDTDKGGWIHEEELRDLVDKLVKAERGKNPAVTADNFIKPIAGEERIRTAVQSVEDLYPENLRMDDSVDNADIQEQDELSENNAAKVDSKATLIAQAGIVRIGAADAIDNLDGVDPHTDTEEEPSRDSLSVSEALAENLEHAVGAKEVMAGENDQLGHSTSRTLKRHNPFEDLEPRKRGRISTIQTVPRVSLSQRITQGQRDPTILSQKLVENEPPHPNQLSQRSIKAQGKGEPSTLSFPVVKDPNNPSTILRLSQSDYSNSQEFPKNPAAMHPSTKKVYESPKTPWTTSKKSSFGQGSNASTPESDTIALVKQLEKTYAHTTHTLYYGNLPPSVDMVEETWAATGRPPVIYQDAFYGNEDDVPDRPREYAGREFKLQSNTLPYLPPFDPVGDAAANFGGHPPIIRNKTTEENESHLRAQKCSLRNWEFAVAPPSFESVNDWVNQESQRAINGTPEEEWKPDKNSKRFSKALSQIEGPTQRNKHDFKYSQKKKTTSVKHETQCMSIMSLEVHVNSRGTLVPDPAHDEIQCVFWCVQGDEDAIDDKPCVGILCLSSENGIFQRIAKQANVEVEHEEDELDLINRVVDIVRHFDPDIMTGYEVQNGSWGYLIERARRKFEYNLCDELSRVKTLSQGNFGKDTDHWGFTHTSTLRIVGRHMINIWRAMRGELNLLQYTMENVVFHLLHKRIPHYQHSDLSAWYQSPKPRDLSKVLEYFVTRVQLNLEILEANDIVPRTSEQARLLGVDFFSVISRGSQYKVESTMFRIAKPENFILVSPSRRQVGQQNALECLPLVMEPRSDFYTSPLLVLDFQSLYPSVMIAYNYCYSTCLGRIVPWRGQNKMGFMDFKREPQLLELVKDHINIAPNGMMYVKPEMRKSLLAKMLGELLETRVMVKSGMKQDKDDKTLQQLLNNRQLALKLLANVTYGYISASFSGRMPCSEIADSIVQTGRETLEKAIALIHSVERWGAEVVYGDTDSLFIYLKGRTRDQAFTIGEEIADAITKTNPQPIKLKFEKVYHPCVLIAKKRYVGFKYESRQQKEPVFDAKGIETVRRDGTPAEQKIEEKALKTLFRTSDLSQVKKYFQDQCTKIMQGRISIQDFLFAKEVKLGTYSDRGPPPPGALIAAKRMLADPRTEPQYGERVPYVVVTGAPGARLIDRCVSPETVLLNEHIELDAEYYITKNLIPPLERIFNLVGANVRQWYDEMPKIQRVRNISLPIHPNRANAAAAPVKKTLESYMKSSACLICRSKLPSSSLAAPHHQPSAYAALPLCSGCLKRPARSLLRLRETLRIGEQRVRQVDAVCRSCANLPWGEDVKCDSRDCPVFYTLLREKGKVAVLRESVGRVVEVVEDESERRWEREGRGRRSSGKRGVRVEGLEW